jgi:hypothetical protein
MACAINKPKVSVKCTGVKPSKCAINKPGSCDTGKPNNPCPVNKPTNPCKIVKPIPCFGVVPALIKCDGIKPIKPICLPNKPNSTNCDNIKPIQPKCKLVKGLPICTGAKPKVCIVNKPSFGCVSVKPINCLPVVKPKCTTVKQKNPCLIKPVCPGVKPKAIDPKGKLKLSVGKIR